MQAVHAAYRRDIREAWDMHKALAERVRAAIVDVIEESGLNSPQHLRLRYALSGTGPGEPSAAALDAVRKSNKDADRLSPAQRLAVLKGAMPTSPRGWWTGEEADAFIDRWQELVLPPLTMGDGQGSHYLFWCVDPGRAAEMLGLLNHADVDDGSFTIEQGEYSVSIVLAGEEKETNRGDS